MNEERKYGTVARLVPDRVFGFIFCQADGRDYFFHQAQLENCTFHQLRPGSDVSFVVGFGKKGKVEATEIRLDTTRTEPVVGHETREQLGMPDRYAPKKRR